MYAKIKKQGKYAYWWVCESYRENGRPKSRWVKYIGKKKPTAGELEEIIKGVK